MQPSAAVGVLSALGAGTLSAQGVTTAAVTGTVRQESGATVEGAVVTVTFTTPMADTNYIVMANLTEGGGHIGH